MILAPPALARLGLSLVAMDAYSAYQIVGTVWYSLGLLAFLAGAFWAFYWRRREERVRLQRESVAPVEAYVTVSHTPLSG